VGNVLDGRVARGRGGVGAPDAVVDIAGDRAV
jgi:hypothetical protein